ncbi:TPA: EpsG family protein [Streptococcus suis]
MNIRVRLSTLIAFPLIILQYILFSFNTENADMLQYNIRYNNIIRFGPRYFGNFVDIGFNYLIFFIQKISSEYQGFLIILGIIIFFLLLQLCRYYNANQLVFFSIFLFTFFFIEAVIVRQFIASALLATGFIFVSEKSNTINKFMSVCIITLALSMHVSAFLGYIYFLSEKVELKKLYYASLIGMILSFPLTNIILPFLTRLLGAKFALYIDSGSSSLVSFISKVLFVLITALLFQLVYTYITKNASFFTLRQRKLAELALKSTLINGLCIPLMMIDISFERLLIVPVFIYLTTLSFFFGKRTSLSYNTIYIFITVLIWIVVSYRIFVWSDSSGTTYPILNFNLLWGR